MAQVTAALVKQLREMTDSPMMECKKALVEADGDIDKAVDINEGTIATYVSEDSKLGAILELTCETDFVGNNPKFTGFALDLAKVVAENDPADVEALKACPMGESTVEAELTEMIHVIGENMKIARFQRVTAEDGALGSYVHLGGKLADIVTFKLGKDETAAADEFKTFAHDVAMQIAAAAPVAARRDDVPADVIEHELAIYKAQAAESGKPEAIQEKMAQGRLEKYFKESVLTEQEFVKDSSVTIGQLAKNVGKSLGDEIEVMSFIRYTFGE